jgi:hypothetical protein
MTDRTPLEESLAKSAQQPREHFAAELRELTMQAFDRNQSPVAARKNLPQTRRLVLSWGSALALALLIVLLLTPPGRALAQEILQQFGLLVFTHEPTSAEQSMTATPDPKMVYAMTTVYSDVASASEKAGFPVYYPAFLPEGYVSFQRLQPVDIAYGSSGAVARVGAMFEKAGSGEILSFSQTPWDYPPDQETAEFGTGDATPRAITVSGNDGVWLENYIAGSGLDENNNPVLVRYNVLIWEITTQDGRRFHFWLGSEERLSLEVMLHIAASATP